MQKNKKLIGIKIYHQGYRFLFRGFNPFCHMSHRQRHRGLQGAERARNNIVLNKIEWNFRKSQFLLWIRPRFWDMTVWSFFLKMPIFQSIPGLNGLKVLQTSHMRISLGKIKNMDYVFYLNFLKLRFRNPDLGLRNLFYLYNYSAILRKPGYSPILPM